MANNDSSNSDQDFLPLDFSNNGGREKTATPSNDIRDDDIKAVPLSGMLTKDSGKPIDLSSYTKSAKKGSMVKKVKKDLALDKKKPVDLAGFSKIKEVPVAEKKPDDTGNPRKPVDLGGFLKPKENKDDKPNLAPPLSTERSKDIEKPLEEHNAIPSKKSAENKDNVKPLRKPEGDKESFKTKSTSPKGNAATKPPVKVVGSIAVNNSTVGQLLQAARVSAELSILQVEQVTKINRSFIESLERDDLKRLPAPVYVHAYIKTLCSMYKMDEGAAGRMIQSLKLGKVHIVGEDILQHLEEDKQVNLEEEQKFRRIFFLLALAAILAVGGVVLGVVYGLDAYKNNKEGERSDNGNFVMVSEDTPVVQAFTEKEFESLMVPQSITMTEMPLR